MATDIRRNEGFESTVWWPIPGHPGYEFGDAGEVRHTYGFESNPPQYTNLARSVSTQGYETVSLGRGRVQYHRLVALMAFGRWPEPGEVVRHLDDDPLNNFASNLAFGTQRDNVRDSMRLGRHSCQNQSGNRKGRKSNPTKPLGAGG